VQLHGDERAVLRVQKPVGLGGSTQAIAEEAPRVSDPQDLGVLAVRVGHLKVAGLDLRAQARCVQKRLLREGIHLLDELLQRVRRDEIGAAVEERLNRRGRSLA
jgi:hypothetical protein